MSLLTILDYKFESRVVQLRRGEFTRQVEALAILFGFSLIILQKYCEEDTIVVKHILLLAVSLP